MDKSNLTEGKNLRVKVTREVPKKESIPETVRVILLKEKKLNVRGAVTGKLYVFSGAGSEGDIDIADLPALLKKGHKTSCCGSTNSPYFKVVKE